jgi:hypothetical protein
MALILLTDFKLPKLPEVVASWQLPKSDNSLIWWEKMGL